MKTRSELGKYLFNKGYKVGAEIGVFKGAFARQLCKAGLTVYAIDPWIGYVGAGRTEQVQEKQDINYEIAQHTLQHYDCILVRKTSMDALADFKDDSLDFVYIDGDHRFPFIAEDIYYWYQKIRKGGVISGHDYFNTDPGANNVLCQAGSIVDAFVRAFGIDNLTIFGEDDPTPSWMIVKQ